MRLNRRYSYLLSLILVLIVSFVLSQALHTQRAAAVSGADWRAGRIIDDAIFFNKDAMSVAQIQAFLNAKVPNCDTNGTQLTSRWNAAANRYYTRAEWGASAGNPAPFTCLKDYRENPTTKQNNYGNNAASIPGAVSAAQLIWNAAQQYGINPQVLLVLLQKEQSLITDDWPYKTQYNAATGAYCPDSGPGGSANCDSSQAGFSTQVYGAAALYDYYKRHLDEYNYGIGNNYILWNVAPSGCGGGNVYIENIATAMLYIYTPYQPNQASLSNLYGTGDGCSAYGNRNFWRLFNDWFGSTRYYYGTKPASLSYYAGQPCQITLEPAGSVYRLYNPDTQDYLLTIERVEACFSIRHGYIYDGILLSSTGADSPESIGVARLSSNGRHLYTTSNEVKLLYTSLGWLDEGIKFYGYSATSPNRSPVYQLGNDYTSLVTADTGEAALLVRYFGLSNFGVAFFIDNRPPSSSYGEVVFRLRTSSTRLYTSSPQEQQLAEKKLGFTAEKDLFQSNDSYWFNEESLPIYRLRSQGGQFLYTNSRTERDLAVINHGYISEGYSFKGRIGSKSQEDPVFRLVQPWNGIRLYTSDTLEKDEAIRRHRYSLEGISWFGK